MSRPSLRTPLYATAIVATLSVQLATGEDDSRQRLFQRVFGSFVEWDPAMVQRVKQGEPGQRHYVDRDGDERPEEVWFIDTHSEHLDAHRPLMVRVIDEDEDLRHGDEPDRDSDLYLADWQSDGDVDAVLDYVDRDGDHDVDEMGAFFYMPPRNPPADRPALRVWWSRDDGDDNLLWHTLGYRYYQRPSQHHTHFGGDETFCSLNLFEGSEHWTPLHEMPFLFYDNDEDGVSEEVIRVTGFDQTIETLRWSFDATNRATLQDPRDYDVSISAFAPGYDAARGGNSDFSLQLDPRYSERLTIRGIPIEPIVRRTVAQGFLRPRTWGRVAMTWVENDHNVGWQRDYQEERWEGVIVHRSADMQAIGGPSAGPFNNRNEIWLNPTGPNAFYYNPSDQRIHLKHADRAWIDVDYDGDDKRDMRYEFLDTNDDGFFDSVTLDVDDDGNVDDRWRLATDQVEPVAWEWREIHGVYAPRLAEQAESLYELNQTLRASLQATSQTAAQDAVWNLLESNMRESSWSDRTWRKFASSEVALVYFLKLTRDRMIVELKTATPKAEAFWSSFGEARAAGDAAEMTALLRKQFAAAESEVAFEPWVAARRTNSTRPEVAWRAYPQEQAVAWENENVGYYFIDGRIGFFGKRQPALILANVPEREPIWKDPQDHDWGMNGLRVDDTAGCGGLALYVNDQRFPLYAGDVRWQTGLVELEDDSVTVEAKAKGVGPEVASYDVTIRPTLRAGDHHAAVEVRIEGGRANDRVELGLGLTRLDQETLLVDSGVGAIGLWGVQHSAVGWLGTGLLYPSARYARLATLDDQYEVRLTVDASHPVQYGLICQWGRGRRFPYAPAASDWLERLRRTATEMEGM